MKQSLTILIILILCFLQVSAQNSLKGTVSVQNSEKKTGKRIVVPNAVIQCNKAQDKKSDSEGKFTLEINDSIGKKIAIWVTPKGNYENYVVVNKKNLNDYTFGYEPVSVFICRKDELEQCIAQMEGINIKKYQDKIRQLESVIDSLVEKLDYDNPLYTKTMEELKKLSENKGENLKKLLELAEIFAYKNWDDEDERTRKIYEWLEVGQFDCILDSIKREDLNTEYQIIQQKQEKLRNVKKLIESEEEALKTKIEKQIETFLILADIANIQCKYDSAEVYYQEAIRRDTLIYDTKLKYIQFLRDHHRHEDVSSQLLPVMLQLDSLYKQQPNVYDTIFAQVLHIMGDNYRQRRFYKEADSLFIQSLKMCETIIEQDPTTDNYTLYFANISGIIYSLEKQKEFEKIETYHNLLLNMDTTIILKDSTLRIGYIMSFVGIGNSYLQNEKYDEAEDLLTNALNMLDMSESEFLRIVILQSLSLLYVKQDRNDKAEELYMQELDRLKNLPEQDPQLFAYHLSLAVFFLEDKNKIEELMKQSMEILETQEKQMIEDIRQLGYGYNILSFIYSEQKRYDEIINLAPKALKIFDNLTDQDYKYNENRLGFLCYLGDSYLHTNKHAEAQNYYIEALKILEKSFNVSINSNKASIQAKLSECYYYTDEYIKAWKALQEALKIYRKLAEENPETYLLDVAKALNRLAILLIPSKELSLKYAREAIEVLSKCDDTPFVKEELEKAKWIIGEWH